jgi:hypothetical protein
MENRVWAIAVVPLKYVIPEEGAADDGTTSLRVEG